MFHVLQSIIAKITSAFVSVAVMVGLVSAPTPTIETQNLIPAVQVEQNVSSKQTERAEEGEQEVATNVVPSSKPTSSKVPVKSDSATDSTDQQVYLLQQQLEELKKQNTRFTLPNGTVVDGYGNVVYKPTDPPAVILVPLPAPTPAPSPLLAPAPVVPTVTLTSNKNFILLGEAFNLSWSAMNADYCRFEGDGWGWSGTTNNASGNQIIVPDNTGTYTFHITCYRTLDYSSKASVTVAVSEFPTTQYVLTPDNFQFDIATTTSGSYRIRVNVIDKTKQPINNIAVTMSTSDLGAGVNGTTRCTCEGGISDWHATFDFVPTATTQLEGTTVYFVTASMTKGIIFDPFPVVPEGISYH